MSPPAGTTGALCNSSIPPAAAMAPSFLIDHPDCELHLSPVRHERVDLPGVGKAIAFVVEDRRAVRIVDRDVEVCAIEQIEDLESQLYLHPCGQSRGLDQCQIDR